jgi:hypothetical protein
MDRNLNATNNIALWYPVNLDDNTEYNVRILFLSNGSGDNTIYWSNASIINWGVGNSGGFSLLSNNTSKMVELTTINKGLTWYGTTL